MDDLAEGVLFVDHHGDADRVTDDRAADGHEAAEQTDRGCLLEVFDHCRAGCAGDHGLPQVELAAHGGQRGEAVVGEVLGDRPDPLVERFEVLVGEGEDRCHAHAAGTGFVFDVAAEIALLAALIGVVLGVEFVLSVGGVFGVEFLTCSAHPGLADQCL